MDDIIQHEAVRTAREYATRALAGLNVLHLGPLDYNITTAVDELRTAAAILEQFGIERASSAKAEGRS